MWREEFGCRRSRVSISMSDSEIKGVKNSKGEGVHYYSMTDSSVPSPTLRHSQSHCHSGGLSWSNSHSPSLSPTPTRNNLLLDYAEAQMLQQTVVGLVAARHTACIVVAARHTACIVAARHMCMSCGISLPLPCTHAHTILPCTHVHVVLHCTHYSVQHIGHTGHT